MSNRGVLVGLCALALAACGHHAPAPAPAPSLGPADPGTSDATCSNSTAYAGDCPGDNAMICNGSDAPSSEKNCKPYNPCPNGDPCPAQAPGPVDDNGQPMTVFCCSM